MTKKHYTYWLKDDNGNSYIGVRSCNGEPEDDNYWSSSKLVKELIKIGTRFEKSILGVWNTREEAIQHEILLHNMWNVDKNPLFYNAAKQTSSKFVSDTRGFKHSDKTIALFKEQKLGDKNPNFGKKGPDASAYGHKHTEEQKKTMANFGPKNGMFSKSHTKKSVVMMKRNRPNQEGEKNPFYGKIHSEFSKRYGDKNHMFNIGENHPNAKVVNTPIGKFNMVKLAAIAIGVNEETIRNRIKSSAEQFREYYYIKDKENETS